MRVATSGTAWVLVAAMVLGAGGGSIQAATRARPARSTTDSVLVRLAKEVITTGMVQRRIEELPEHVRPQFTTPDGRQRLLDRMVEERVWLLTSLRSGVAARPDVQRQIEQQRRDLLIRTYINELMGSAPAPSDSEAKVYYDEHASDYQLPATVTISHILLKTEAEGKRIRQWARSGQDWSKLAVKYSADTLTRSRGGTLGPATREGVFGHLGKQPALAESAFALGEGKIGGPCKTDLGWHVIKVDALKAEGERGFDQVRGSIVRQLSSKRSQDFYQARLTEAKTTLGVRPDSGAIKKFMSLKKTAREMFNEAQTAGAPAARIEAYRKLLEEYPDSEVSAQAAFMIGFIQSEELKDFDAAQKSFGDLLAKYPHSELAASARWMTEHMRSESAPEFMNLESDSAAADSGRGAPRPARAAPRAGKTAKGGSKKP